jgi:hypothetical protein
MKRTYCVCATTNDEEFMVQCGKCGLWFHPHCLGLSTEFIDNHVDKMYCLLSTCTDVTMYSKFRVRVATAGYAIASDIVHINNGKADMEVKKRISSYRMIFNGNDRKRQQRDVVTRDIYLNQIVERVSDFLRVHFPEHTVTHPIVLRSQAGCRVQPAHTDYAPYQLQSSRFIDYPLGCIVSLFDDTAFTFWPSLFGNDLIYDIASKKPVKPVVILLQAGDILVFRGDQVHAGSAYENENFRIHFYLDTIDNPRPINKVWRIDKQPNVVKEMLDSS